MRKLRVAFRNLANEPNMKTDFNTGKNLGWKNFIVSSKLVAEVKCCVCGEEESPLC